MRILSALLFILLVTFSSCSSPEDKAAEKAKQDSIDKMASRGKYLAEVENAEKVMRGSTTYDQKLAMATLKAYNDFAVTFPEDTLTPEYLFRAADLAQGARNYQQAAIYLETIIERHKGYRKYEDACFVAAFIYDTYLEDVNNGGDRAVQLYQYIINNYPNTTDAEQSKVLIKYIGKPDSVMINDIIKKGGK